LLAAAWSRSRRPAPVSGQALALDGWADGDVADFDVMGLLDGEGDGPADRFLGRGVDRLGRDDLQSRGGHRGHEVSLALPAEHRERGRDAVEHAPEVDVDHRRPAVDVEVGHRPDLADAGVADQHVEPAELLNGRVYQALEVRAAGDVGRAGDGTPAVVADLVRELVQAVGTARAQGDGGAALREQARGGLTDAAARPGDGDDLAVDAGHREPPRVKWTRVRLSSSVP